MKYEPDLNRLGLNHGDEPIVSRLSELYLNAAEAACMLGSYNDARNYIRPILERAVDVAYADDVLAATADYDMLDLVRTERVKELCFEGHNFFDIVRWKMDLVRENATTSIVKSYRLSKRLLRSAYIALRARVPTLICNPILL